MEILTNAAFLAPFLFKLHGQVMTRAFDFAPGQPDKVVRDVAPELQDAADLLGFFEPHEALVPAGLGATRQAPSP